MSPGSSDEASQPATASATVIEATVLSERRAQRELGDAGAAQRAAAAERAVVTMETRLTEVETRLAAARAERDTLAAQLLRRDRELAAARQREFAELQVRLETEEELAAIQRSADEEIADLRVRLAAAEHAAEQAGADRAGLDAANAAPTASAAEIAALQDALDNRLRAVVDRLALLRDEIGAGQAELERRLLAEVAARQAAEARVESHVAAAEELAATERGRAARLVAEERERSAAQVEVLCRRADEEAVARRAAEAALLDARAAASGATAAVAPAPAPAPTDTAAPPTAAGPAAVAPPASVVAVQAELARLKAARAIPGAPAPPEGAQDLIEGLGRAAERLRAQADEAAAAAAMDPSAEPGAEVRLRWWQWRRRLRAQQLMHAGR
jgi:chromosome segregation ATPase